MVLMVESICGQGFAYAREVKEDRQKKLVKTRAKRSYKGHSRRLWLNRIQKIWSKPNTVPTSCFYRRWT
jgi:hypothetical protein